MDRVLRYSGVLLMIVGVVLLLVSRLGGLTESNGVQLAAFIMLLGGVVVYMISKKFRDRF